MADEPDDFAAAVNEAQRAFRSVADEARVTLIEICSFGLSEQARISAAKEILDRAYGKSVSQVELSGRGGGPIETKETSEAAALFAARMARLAAAANEDPDESDD